MGPRTIFSLWLQGLDQAPELVRLCFQRWRSQNPTYELQILDASDAGRLLAGSPIPLERIPPQALSDVVRACVLALHGGIWVDAAVLPVRPLDTWLPGCWVGGFFAFERPQPDRALASWFLAATARHPLMEKWWHQVTRYWSKPRKLVLFNGSHIPPDPVWEVAPDGGAVHDRYPYFWFHYLFGYLLQVDPTSAQHWSLCPKLSAQAPHALQALFFREPEPSPDMIAAAAATAPLQKLNWRHAYPLQVLERL